METEHHPLQLHNTCNLNIYRENQQRLNHIKTALAAQLHREWDGKHHPQQIKLAILHGQNQIGQGKSIDQAAVLAQEFINDPDLLG